MSKYIVTGGAGFIGSNIVERLLKEGKETVVIDNFSTGKKKNLDIASKNKNCKIVEGDIRNINILLDNFSKDAIVFHQAAIPSVQRSIADPVTTSEVNIQGTLNVLTAARKKGVHRVIFAGSSSVYGNSPTLPKVETMSPSPMSPYALQKLSAEYYCGLFYELYGLETISLRYFNVFGPHQDPASEYAAVIPKFITSAILGQAPIIYGNGEQSRDFTYIDNVVNANLLALDAEKTKGEAVNVACRERHSLNQLVKMLSDILNTCIAPVYAEPRKGDVKDSLADISLAKKVINYEPVVTFKNGLIKTIEWYKEKQV